MRSKLHLAQDAFPLSIRFKNKYIRSPKRVFLSLLLNNAWAAASGAERRRPLRLLPQFSAASNGGVGAAGGATTPTRPRSFFFVAYQLSTVRLVVAAHAEQSQFNAW